MSELHTLLEWLDLGDEDSAELLEVVAWTRQQITIQQRGYPSDEPGGGVSPSPDLAAQLLVTARDFDVSPRIIDALERRAV